MQQAFHHGRNVAECSPRLRACQPMGPTLYATSITAKVPEVDGDGQHWQQTFGQVRAAIRGPTRRRQNGAPVLSGFGVRVPDGALSTVRSRDRPVGPTTLRGRPGARRLTIGRGDVGHSADARRVSPSREDHRLGIRLPPPHIPGSHPGRPEWRRGLTDDAEVRAGPRDVQPFTPPSVPSDHVTLTVTGIGSPSWRT